MSKKLLWSLCFGCIMALIFAGMTSLSLEGVRVALPKQIQGGLFVVCVVPVTILTGIFGGNFQKIGRYAGIMEAFIFYFTLAFLILTVVRTLRKRGVRA